MINPDKYYVPPPHDGSDFKELFKRLTAAGAGRPVDESGFADGPWSPDQLLRAITEVQKNDLGVELRTVQLWFQDNEKGISPENIRWLARIFGCDDPDATSEWQTELVQAQERLTAKRRSKKQNGSTEEDEQDALVVSVPVDHEDAPKGLATFAEAMFRGHRSLNLPIAVWGGMGVLWFLAFIFGMHNISYSPLVGVEKHVGFVWSPAWNIGDLILLPVFLMLVAEVVNHWRENGRSMIADPEAEGGWLRKVQGFKVSFWAIMIVCVVVVFVLQWLGVYFMPLSSDNADVVMIDWLLVALKRPDIVSIQEAIVTSFAAFVFSGMIYWFFFAGLLLLYVVSADFSEIFATEKDGSRETDPKVVAELGAGITYGIFRCAVVGCFIALTIKLNAAYLVSDAETISGWLRQDALVAVGVRDEAWGWIDGSPSPFFTSLLLLFLICFVFFACLAQIALSLERSLDASSAKRGLRNIWLKMSGVILLLGLSFVLIGQFVGFSILLVGSVIVGVISLFWRQALSVR